MKRILFAIVLLFASVALCFAGERDGYTLEEMVVLSRHNIRSPLSGGGSVLSRITPCEWFEWTSAPGELSLKGAVLETQMGQYFSSWAESEGLFGRNAVPLDEEVQFYSNSLQRTIATAQYFSSGMFPLANVRIRHDKKIGVMDPMFTPKITCSDEKFLSEAYSQIEAFGGEKGLRGIGEKMAPNYAVLEKVLRMSKSPAAANDTVRVPLHDTSVKLTPGKEPSMSGGFKMATSAADALVLQYYEEPSLRAASFGRKISRAQWEAIVEIKDRYVDVLFTAPAVARNVAQPLLAQILSELRASGRKFSFLCGHDSNVASVLAALGCKEYHLPDALEKKTPIGCKLVFAKYFGKDGREYAEVLLVYASDTQFRQSCCFDGKNAPARYSLSFEGLSPNEDGLYLLSDLEARFEEVID